MNEVQFNVNSLLKDWLMYWVEVYVRPVSKPASYEHYRDNCVKHIIPVIGDIPLGNVTPAVLQRFFNAQAQTGNLLTGGPLSTKSLRNMRVVLDVALKVATALEYIPSNPVPLTAIKSVRSRKMEIMTNEMQERLEEYLFTNSNTKNAGVMFALYSGMRLGEICALRFSAYDENTCMLRVDTTVKRLPIRDETGKKIGTQLTFNSAKTDASNRDLYMPEVLQKVIASQKERFAKEFGREPTGDDFIVYNTLGTTMEPINLSHYFADLLNKLGLSHVKFHAIRHTFATRAIENGVAVSTVSGLLGHSDVTTTTHFYVHPRADAMREAMRAITPVAEESVTTAAKAA